MRDLDGRKDPDEHRENPERSRVERAHPGDEHVMAPREKAHERDPERRIGDGLVRVRILVSEGRDDLADDPHRREDHDVDRGVRVEPEEVLVEHRIPAARRVEEPPLEPVIESHDEEREPEDRRSEHLDGAGAVHRPHEEGHSHPRHAVGPHRVHGRDEVDPRDDRGNADDEDAEHRGDARPRGTCALYGA